jgi:hypothetical protein
LIKQRAGSWYCASATHCFSYRWFIGGRFSLRWVFISGLRCPYERFKFEDSRFKCSEAKVRSHREFQDSRFKCSDGGGHRRAATAPKQGLPMWRSWRFFRPGRGLDGFVGRDPSDESPGYYRSSRRDFTGARI